jgi:hypothetical protein
VLVVIGFREEASLDQPHLQSREISGRCGTAAACTDDITLTF